MRAGRSSPSRLSPAPIALNAPASMLYLHRTAGHGDGSRDGLAWPWDEIEWDCCTAEWRDDAWRHERSCPMQAARVKAGR